MKNTAPVIYQIHHPDGWGKAEEPKGCFFDDRPMVTDPKNGMIVNATRYPHGFYKPLHRHGCSHGIYVVKGKLKTDHGTYGPNTLVWHPSGCETGHGSTDDSDCLFLFIANKPFDIEFLSERSEGPTPGYGIHSLPQDWTDGAERTAVLDEETGMSIRFLHFEKGFSQKWQRSCACGLYVIEGTLEADGQLYEPGTLIWLPEETPVELSTNAEACSCLYMTNA